MISQIIEELKAIQKVLDAWFLSNEKAHVTSAEILALRERINKLI